MSDFEEFESTAKIPEKNTNSIIGHAFDTYKGIIWIAVVAIILLVIVSSIISTFFGGSYVAMQQITDTSDLMNSYRSILSPSYVLIQLLSIVITAPLWVGFIYLSHQKNSGKEVSFGDLFIGYKQNTLNIIIYAIITGIIQSIALGLCLLPAIFIMPLFLIGYPILLFENAGAIDAIKKSFQIAKENYWTFVGAGVLGALISIAGVIACGIGVLFTLAFIYAVMYSAYVAFVGLPKQVQE